MRESPITISCKYCGKESQMHSYRIKNGTGKYCGQECYLASRWAKSGKCQQCGGDCALRFCSKRCQKDYWNANGYKIHKHPSNWKRKLALISELGGKCLKCGFDDYRALQINHIDPSTKVRAAKGQWNWLARFKDWEANKGNLELLCANCHSLHTWEQMGYGLK